MRNPVDLPRNTHLYGYLQKPSLVDYPGNISAVFFTAGCNFSCGYCHNAPLMKKKEAGISAEEFTAAVEHFQKSDWITGVTLSGGEPTCNTHLPELIAWLHSRGLHIKLDTNGSNPDMLSKILPLLDYVAMDIKCSLDNYPSFVGYPHAEKIQESVHLLLLWDRGTAEFRTTVLESYHNKKELSDMGKLISSANHYTLQPFVPRENLPDPALRTQPRTSPQFLKQAADIMKPYVKQVSIKGRM